MPVVICTLEPGEAMITEKGGMAWMSPNMEMATQAGGIGKAFGRIFSGESVFLNTYTCMYEPGIIAFSSSIPGSIKAVEITPDKPIIAQKTAFLAATDGVELSVAFQKKASTGFFGGEGFVMQRLTGNGMAFLEIDGSVVEYDLLPGQQLIVDTGYLAFCEETVSIDAQFVKGLKNMVFGGEGIFNTVLTGPGKVALQTMPMSTLANTLSRFMPSKN